jgi:hypothetical protein
VAEIGSAQADEVEGAGTVVPAAGAAHGAGAQPGTLAGETAAQGDAVVEPVVAGAGASGDGLAEPMSDEQPRGAAGDVPAEPETDEQPAEAEEGTADGEVDAVVPAVAATGFMQRAVIRRRVRFLRRRRELALHDLGGFAFESHRLGQPREELLAQKLSAISELDDELATLQDALGRHEEVAVLREPGISSCPQCSTIHDSAARYCPTCGRPTAGKPS